MQFGKSDNILVVGSESVEFEILSACLTVLRPFLKLKIQNPQNQLSKKWLENGL